MRLGRELASILACSCVQSQPRETKISNENLRIYFPFLSEAGAAALTWFGIYPFESSLTREVAKLYRDAYVRSAAQALAHEAALARAVQSLNASAIRSILFKGWSVGRLYPESGLRPSGDIDLWVEPDQRADAAEILQSLAAARQLVDLDHDQFHRFENRSFEVFYASCNTVHLGSTPIRVLRREDQTRILCLHFLKHGGWRPIWLCDIAIVLESQSRAAFNWELCLGSDARRACWIGCTIALARDLLGATIPQGAPRWVTAS